MRILVTGGGGWIGRHVCRELAGRGDDPVAFDRTTNGDVTDLHQVREAIVDCDGVIHLAGLLGTHELFVYPAAAVDVNVGGTLNVLEACKQRHVRYVGITMPDVNPSIYTATKMCGRRLADAYRAAYDLPVSHVIAYNAFGKGQPYGEGHPQKIIPTFSRAVWTWEPIPIWGDGSLVVDLVHVADVAAVLVAALAYGDGQTFDAGTGVRQTVLNVARTVESIAGRKVGYEFLPPRPGERRGATWWDAAHQTGWDLLGWHPEFRFDQFAETVESYK